MGLSNVVFILIAAIAIALFTKQVRKIARNIKLGRDLDRSDRPAERWKVMARVALGQSKMVVRPVAGFMHILIYVGFVIINIEVLEIILDGVLGTHRLFFGFLGNAYTAFINAFEFLALLVLVACVVFLLRRNVMRIKRFFNPEMEGWPTSDANIILVVEVLLMGAFLTMNASDAVLMNTAADSLTQAGLEKYAIGFDGYFAFSQYIIPFLPESLESLHLIERGMWWFHIIGIFAFLNYLPYSKHFHILLAFPNTYFSNLNPKGSFSNMESVTNEVKLMFDPDADPYAAPAPEADAAPQRFGAKDVQDLTWKQLMDSYTCTECGRCTSNCPANQTGKLLSPRKIMMDTRDRLVEVGNGIDKNGADFNDGKSLLNDFITPEELWACTSCNACVESCPVNIDPLSIIMEMRRYLVMEESAAPQELNGAFTNIENNGAPWQFGQADRLNWATEEN